MNREQVLELVRLQLADILEISPDGISESSSFSEDLNADSLALIELVESLEEELRNQVADFRIDDEDSARRVPIPRNILRAKQFGIHCIALRVK